MTASPTDPNAPKKTRVWLVLLIVFGVLVALVMIAVAGVVWWFSANKDKFIALGKEADEAAVAFAATHDQDACVEEGFKKVDACDGVMCQAGAKIFVERCIARAEKKPGFCDGVPPPNEIMQTVRWVQEQCPKRGRRADDQRCQQIMQAVPPACHR
jgi:hypothetical protein